MTKKIPFIVVCIAFCMGIQGGSYVKMPESLKKYVPSWNLPRKRPSAAELKALALQKTAQLQQAALKHKKGLGITATALAVLMVSDYALKNSSAVYRNYLIKVADKIDVATQWYYNSGLTDDYGLPAEKLYINLITIEKKDIFPVSITQQDISGFVVHSPLHPYNKIFVDKSTKVEMGTDLTDQLDYFHQKTEQDQIKIALCNAVYIKFIQDPEFRENLMDTGKKYIVILFDNAVLKPSFQKAIFETPQWQEKFGMIHPQKSPNGMYSGNNLWGKTLQVVRDSVSSFESSRVVRVKALLQYISDSFHAKK